MTPIPPAGGARPASRFPVLAWLREVIRGVTARPGRVALTIAGTMLGTATLVAVLGLTASAQGQISDRFSLLRAQQVDVTSLDPAYATGGFPLDADQRVARLTGVNAAGLAWQVDTTTQPAVTSTIIPGLLGPPPSGISVYATSTGMLTASRARFTAGRGFDPFCLTHRCHTAILGSVAAQQLGITHFTPGMAISIDGQVFTVSGIVSDVQRNTPLLGSVMVPTTTALDMWGKPTQQPWMTIDVQVGAAQVIGSEVPYALRPEATTTYQVTLPPDPRSLQASVGNDLNSLFLVLAIITVLVGAFGIANLTTVAVIERIPEIGLRRALGARPIHIGTQFVGEAACLGLLGGLFGTPLGIFTIVTVCLARHWTALMPTWLLTTPLMALTVGLIAGIYPAWRAAHVEPVTALQR